MTVPFGPCRGPAHLSDYAAAKDAKARYGTVAVHRCPAGHSHADRPSLAARVRQLLKTAVA